MPTAIFIFDTSGNLNAAIDRSVALHAPDGHELIAAEIRAGHQFIWQYRGSKDTFATYRKELEKLHQYQLTQTPGIPIGRYRSANIEEFINWCVTPDGDWIADKVYPRVITAGDRAGEPNPKWRPFSSRGAAKAYALSKPGLASLFAVISSYYEYLIQEGLSLSNPVKAVRQKGRYFVKETQVEIRRITNEQVSCLRQTAEQMAAEHPSMHERTLFILCLLLNNYLRISEIIETDRHTPRMGDVRKKADLGWWLTVVGKGNKRRHIPLSNASVTTLKRYRRHLGLATDMPTPGESTPLLAKLPEGKLLPLRSVRQVRDIINELISKTHANMCANGQENEAEELVQATVHWLRHTGISEDVKVRPKEHVKDDAGHESLATTDRYIDIELRERAASRHSLE